MALLCLKRAIDSESFAPEIEQIPHDLKVSTRCEAYIRYFTYRQNHTLRDTFTVFGFAMRTRLILQVCRGIWVCIFLMTEMTLSVLHVYETVKLIPFYMYTRAYRW
jgi:hypothetical protein